MLVLASSVCADGYDYSYGCESRVRFLVTGSLAFRRYSRMITCGVTHPLGVTTTQSGMDGDCLYLMHVVTGGEWLQ